MLWHCFAFANGEANRSAIAPTIGTKMVAWRGIVGLTKSRQKGAFPNDQFELAENIFSWDMLGWRLNFGLAPLPSTKTGKGSRGAADLWLFLTGAWPQCGHAPDTGATTSLGRTRTPRADWNASWSRCSQNFGSIQPRNGVPGAVCCDSSDSAWAEFRAARNWKRGLYCGATMPEEARNLLANFP